MKIMLSAGEASGDVHGENIARAILSMAPETELIGFGGSRMEEAGVRLRQNFADYSVMGVWEVLINIRRLFKLLSDLTEFMKEEKPDMLVLIDYPDFNWRLAKKAKALGIPVFSYIPPSAWAWRMKCGRKVLKQLEPNTSMPNANVRRSAVGLETIASAASLKLARSSPPFLTSGGVSLRRNMSATVHATPTAPNPQNPQRQPSAAIELNHPASALAMIIPK